MTDEEKIELLSIEDLKDKVCSGEIMLPPIQRGFVWKPYQIENFWDAILRGFPVGCFIAKKRGNIIEVLDGQQRLTSILLGLNFEDNDNFDFVKKILKIKEEMKIFLDLEKNTKYKSKDDNRKYNIRVITKSHPWGYQRKDNKKTLGVRDIEKQKEIIWERCNIKENKKGYFKNRDFFEKSFPFDAKCPISLNEIFVDGYCFDSIKDKNSNIDFINETAKDLRKLVFDTKIPIMYIKDDEKTNNAESSNKNEDVLDNDEYLFTLINRGGTRVSNNDLNYSLVKSKLLEKYKKNGRKIIEHIEKIANNSNISASLFVMICYFWFETNKRDLTTKEPMLYVSPKQFRRKMLGNDEFLSFLINKVNYDDEKEEYIDDEKKIEIIEKLEKCLVYDRLKNPFGMPFVMFLNILNTKHELSFLMFYLIDKFEKDFKDEMGKNLIVLTMVMKLFSYKKNSKKNILKEVVSKFMQFAECNRKENFQNIIKDFFESKKLNIEEIMQYPIAPYRLKTKDVDDYSINRIKYEKDFLLYAQRDFLDKEFGKEAFVMDDMNMPFDYDHIFPSKNRAWGNPRNWDTIGNYRAWPYDKNRSDKDDLPCKKFRKNDVLDDDILRDSFCLELKDRFDDYKDKKQDTIVAEEIIIERISLIYKHWYEALEIHKFFKKSQHDTI